MGQRSTQGSPQRIGGPGGPSGPNRPPASVSLSRQDVERIFATGGYVAVNELGLQLGDNLATRGATKSQIRNILNSFQLTNYPYIPGSSLRGKMRALLDRWRGNPANRPIGNVRIHMPETEADYRDSPVGRLFGVLPNASITSMRPTRLLLRDVYLGDEEASRLRERARGGLLYTEAKTEAAIDRLTSAASPRTIERVLAGAVFKPFLAAITLYDRDDVAEYVPLLLRGMRLLEDDYLGGHGSRGSGEITFKAPRIVVRRPEDYAFPFGQGTVVAEGADLFDGALNDAALLDRLAAAVGER